MTDKRTMTFEDAIRQIMEERTLHEWKQRRAWLKRQQTITLKQRPQTEEERRIIETNLADCDKVIDLLERYKVTQRSESYRRIAN